MSYIDFLEKRETLKRLIESEKTGTAEELANRLCFSRRTLFNYLDLLENEGLYIKFCRMRKTYYLEKKEGSPNPSFGGEEEAVPNKKGYLIFF